MERFGSSQNVKREFQDTHLPLDGPCMPHCYKPLYCEKTLDNEGAKTLLKAVRNLRLKTTFRCSNEVVIDKSH